MNARLLGIALVAALLLCPLAYGQFEEPPSTGSPMYRLPDRTTLAGQTGFGPLLTAVLVDKDSNAKKHQAVVKVQTAGVKLISSAAANHQPKLDEAHIQYRLDNGPVHNTTSESWTFHDLSPGKHHIHVNLADSLNSKMGMGKTLNVDVP